MKAFRDMTPDKQLAWGREELAARKADLLDRSADGLARAQTNAESRRKKISASRSQAANAVARATREIRCGALR